jgi:hypothetical protein
MTNDICPKGFLPPEAKVKGGFGIYYLLDLFFALCYKYKPGMENYSRDVRHIFLYFKILTRS